MVRDLRYGLRSIGKSPGFAAVVLITLGFAIGGNTIIFSAINGILVEHWPYADASRLLLIQREQIAWGITLDEARTIEEQSTAFQEIAVANGVSASVSTLEGIPTSRSNAEVSGNFFSLLGVEPLLGRYIVPADTEPGGAPVAVLSYDVWRDVFGGDEEVVGKEVFVGENRFSVIGVMPPTYDLGVVWTDGSGVWMPLVDTRPERRNSWLVARVKSGIPLSTAQDQLAALSPRLMDRFPAGTDNVDLVAEQPGLITNSSIRGGLLVLQGAIAFVLLLACVNISALLVARAWSRQRELAIRKTLGASRLRIVRQLLSESLVLAIAGGILGCLLAVGGIRVLLAIAPPDTPRLDRIGLDASVLIFTFAVAVVAAMLFGLLPALQAAHRKGDSIPGGLSAISVKSATRQRRFLQNGLVIFEVALAVLLVIGGGLMVRSFDKLMRIDPVVEPDRALVVSVRLGASSCRPSCWQVADLLDEIEALPGIERAGISAAGPLGGGTVGLEVGVEGAVGTQPLEGSQNYVSSGFFRAAGIRLLRGRNFQTDNETSVAVVNEAFANRYLEGNPLGRRFYVSAPGFGDEADERDWLEVIGVVNNTRNRSIRRVSGANVYTASASNGTFFTLTVRTAQDPESVAVPIQQIIRARDRFAVVNSARTLEQALYESAALPRFYTTLFGFFGILALSLAMIGVYGVTSYAVVQRTHEMGVRMALGAQRSHVVRRFVAEKARLAGAGVILGLGAALALTRSVEHLLFGIQALDPVTFVSVAVLLFGAALGACYLPARAATKVSPVVALRHE